GTGHGYQNEAVGYLPTRQAFAEFINRYGLNFRAEETVFSYGSLPAFDGILQLAQILAKRDGVPVHLINPEPTFPVVAAQAIRRDIPVISISTSPKTGYCITAESLCTAFENTASNARDVLYIVPMSNPTSSINDPEVLAQAIAEFHRLRPKGMIIVDLAYLEMIPKAHAKDILSRFTKAGVLDQCLFVTSLSKLYGDPGGRAGAIHTNNPLFFQELKTQWQTIYASMASAVENEALAKLKFVTKKARQRLFKLFNTRQKAVLSMLNKIDTDRASKGLEPLMDIGSVHSDIPLYLFVKLNEGFSWLDLFRETGFVVVPGEVFGAKPEDRMVRIAVGTELLEERD
ncbi:MAG: pyridoxal phosphate-dependent aminotransferase, partial [Patescibacteria group bacterium]